MWEIDDPEDAEEGKEQQLVTLLQQIKDYCRFKLGWCDNKFAIELNVDPCWHIFVGFWDWHICIGQAIEPNMYPPKMQVNEYGNIKPIRFR